MGLSASMEMLNMLFHLKVVSTETYVRSLVADTWISHWKSMLDVLIEVKGPTTFAAMFLLQLTTGLGDKVVQRSALVRQEGHAFTPLPRGLSLSSLHVLPYVCMSYFQLLWLSPAV